MILAVSAGLVLTGYIGGMTVLALAVCAWFARRSG